MKASISLDKERIKLKGNGQKFIVRVHPSQGEPWVEPDVYGDLFLGNQDSVGYNSDAELYDWEVKNYETQPRGCQTIQTVQMKHVQQCFLVSIIPKIFEKKSREYPTSKPTNVSIKKIPK